MPHSFTLIVFLRENELFPEGLGGLGHTCGNYGGAGGTSVPCKNGKSRGWGVLSEIPSVVGVWIFSGTTQIYGKKITNQYA